MKLNKKLLIIFGVVVLFLTVKNMENFVDWTELSAFNNKWGDNDTAKTSFRPTKTSDLITGCDAKRGTCITY